MNYASFLENKPLFYAHIDVKRFPRIYQRIASHFNRAHVIHLVGTNGKGSTGRFLAVALHRAGYRVGHYTSPHILRFHERIWLQGELVDDPTLEAAHQHLQTLLLPEESDALSYFEYTTLLALVCFDGCEYILLEAGLGGEYDATSSIEKVLSLFTPIDYDHQSFLGDTIEAIATTKLRSMGPLALIAPQPHPEIYAIAQSIAREKGSQLYPFAPTEAMMELVASHTYPSYLKNNLLVAMVAFVALTQRWEREYFEQIPLLGRLTRLGKNILLDVGHNALAAQAIAQTLAPQRYVLIYNTYADKDFQHILTHLHPIIQRVEILDVPCERIVDPELLRGALDALGLEHRPFEQLHDHEVYLVFGSFSVAETFLRQFPHLAKPFLV